MQNTVNHANYVNKVHSGRLKLKQSANVAMLLKQHSEHHLAANIIRDVEQKTEFFGKQPHARRTTSTPTFVVVSIGWLVDEFVVG